MSGELDMFNDEEAKTAVSKPSTEAWKDQQDERYSDDAVCVVCDVLYTPPPNRPPILCPACKTKLKALVA